MDLAELETKRAQLQASQTAWLQKLEEAKEQVILHRGQLALIEEWIRRIDTTPPAMPPSDTTPANN